MRSNQRPDTLMQDPLRQIDENLLQRVAGPYKGQERRFPDLRDTSEYLPTIACCREPTLRPNSGCGSAQPSRSVETTVRGKADGLVETGGRRHVLVASGG